VKVLYLNHTAEVSGGEQSLLSLIAGLPDEVSATVACPEGPLAKAVRELGIAVSTVPSTQASLKLDLRHTTRGVLDIARASWAVRRISAAIDVDLIHANSIRAGLIAVLATPAGNPPAVVHVRDCLPPSRLSYLTLREIGKRAAVVVPNSRYTEASFARVHPAAATHVIHSPVDLRRFDPAAIDPSEARARLSFNSSTVVLAVIAQITPWKGQDDAIRILKLLDSHQPGLRLLLVGSPKFVGGATRYDNNAYARSLVELTESLGLRDDVMFLGERHDIPEILRAVDLLLVPSWEEPFGRAIIEAMAMEVPVVATKVGGPTEILRPGEDGVLLPPRAPKAWAAEVENLIRRPKLRAEMGRKARERAAQFSVENHVRAVLAAYDEALSGNVR
jgi:glycosyltransferase involved in cell wall biosynthesis